MPAAPAKGTRPVTREEVALHNTRDDCWIIISEKFTTSPSGHPITLVALELPNVRRRSHCQFGDYHSAEAVAHMAHFCIGDLVETSNHLAVTGTLTGPHFRRAASRGADYARCALEP